MGQSLTFAQVLSRRADNGQSVSFNKQPHAWQLFFAGLFASLPDVTAQESLLLLMAYLRAVGTKVRDADTAVGAGCKMFHVAMLWEPGLKPQWHL